MQEIRHAVSLRSFATPAALETSAVLGFGVDAQIGGGVRVRTLSSDDRAVAHSNMRTVFLCLNSSLARRVCSNKKWPR